MRKISSKKLSLTSLLGVAAALCVAGQTAPVLPPAPADPQPADPKPEDPKPAPAPAPGE